MRGRKPIPSSLKKLAGDGFHDSGGRIIPDEPQAIPGAPDVPEELSGDALLAWHSFIEDTQDMNVITHADRGALIVLCETWAEMQQAARHIAKNGTVIKLPNNYPGPNPYVKIRNEARATVLKLLTEFGLTPSSRSRIRLAPTQADSVDDEFAELR